MITNFKAYSKSLASYCWIGEHGHLLMQRDGWELWLDLRLALKMGEVASDHWSRANKPYQHMFSIIQERNL